MNYRILGASLSPFVRKVRVYCAEKHIAYDLEEVSPFAPPEGWSEISPLGRIPVLAIDDDGSTRYLPDSSAICAFLERMHPQPALVPAEPLALGQALWLEEYADSELAAAIGGGVFRPMVLPRMRGGEPDRATAQDAMANRLPPIFDYLERQIDDRTFLIEDRLSIADIAVATHFVNLHHAGYAVDPGHWPALAAFVHRVHDRGSFVQAMEAERRLLG